MGESSFSMQSVWKDLPPDILQNVFKLLPIALLCRFRTLSKQWNRVITGPAFASKHSQAAHPEEYALITLRWGRLDGGWDVLDVASKRYITFSDDFLTKYVQERLALVHGSCKYRRAFLAAADGGLFCVRYSFDEETSALFVCNPVLRTVKQLPPIEASTEEYSQWEEHSQTIVMSMDRPAMEYEVFVINTVAYSHVSYEPDSILIYESKTGGWRTASHTRLDPLLTNPHYQIWWHSLTIFRQNQYCILFRGSGNSHMGMVSYNKITGAVCEIGIDLPYAPRSRLVVTKDRLFCVMGVEVDADELPSVQIFDIDIATKECIKITEMPNELLIWILGHDLHDKYGDKGFGLYVLESNFKVAIGSANCILICAIVGRCVAYSLPKKLWCQYPDDNCNLLETYCHNFNMDHEELYASNYCLSLCAP